MYRRDFRLAAGTTFSKVTAIPSFEAWTAPVPAGVLINEVARDFANQPRANNDLPGAYGGGDEAEPVLFSTYLSGITN